jgi:peptidoglycan L-alanyl-D-glutamate endopeptidase CwlK
MTLNVRSRERMKGVHPDLVGVIEHAAEIAPGTFIVTEGLRTPNRQYQLYVSGASKTLNSRHLTGHAVDLAALVDGKVRWDWPLYHKLAAVVKQAAYERNVPLIWGGDWTSFPDGPHYELDRRVYP